MGDLIAVLIGGQTVCKVSRLPDIPERVREKIETGTCHGWWSRSRLTGSLPNLNDLNPALLIDAEVFKDSAPRQEYHRQWVCLIWIVRSNGPKRTFLSARRTRRASGFRDQPTGASR